MSLFFNENVSFLNFFLNLKFDCFQMLTLFYERCSKYYGAAGGQVLFALFMSILIIVFQTSFLWKIKKIIN
jgi:hypothetical protein